MPRAGNHRRPTAFEAKLAMKSRRTNMWQSGFRCSTWVAGWVLATAVMFGGARPADAVDWKDGDQAVTVEDDVELGYRDKAEAKLPRGHRMSVTEVRDPWIGGVAELHGEKKFGWVHKRQIKLFIEPLGEIAPATDKASARQVLEGIGVKIELNGDDEVIGVDASETRIPDAGLEHLTHFDHLLNLYLSGTSISDAGMAHVGRLKSLEQLYLDQTEITDEGIKQLGELESLDLIILEGTRATGSSLETLKKLPSLRTISLSRCKVNDKQVEKCEAMDGLEVLNLSFTQVTGDTFDTLQPLAKLRVLNVNGAPLKDDGLLKLAEQPTLKMLYIRETQITDDTIQLLKNSLNSCAIYRY